MFEKIIAWVNKLPIVLKIVIFLVFMTILMNVLSKLGNSNIQQQQKQKVAQDSILEKELQETKRNAEWNTYQDSLTKVNAQETIKRLKSKFLVEKDEFRNLEFYTHPTFGQYWPQRITLTAGVNSDGYAWLNSNYYSDDWIFHTYVSIKGPGNYQENLPEVPRYNKNNRTQVNNGVYEVITYEDSRATLMYLAQNYEGRILVRFNGQQYYKDVELSKSDKKALKETYDLAVALQTIKQ